MFHLEALTDAGLLFLRVMAALIFIDSGYLDLINPGTRATSIGESKNFTIFLGFAEVAGGAGVFLGILQQLAAIGLILLMAGAIQKKITVWKTGFWGKQNLGWYYETTLVSMLFVILVTDGGHYVIMP